MGDHALLPIDDLVQTSTKRVRRRRPPSTGRGYELILRGPDGQPRFERFTNRRAYQARLAALGHTKIPSLSIDELATLLDT